MKKHSKLFSTLLVFLLCLDLVAPVAQAMASTDGQVDGFTGLEASPSYEAEGGETVENTAVVSQEEPTTEQNDQQVTVDMNINETTTHPAEQTQGEVVQQENTATQVTIDAQEEEVVEEPSLEEDEEREIQSGGNLIPVNITNTELKGNKDTYHNGDQIGIKMDWNITPGTTVQSGDYFEVSYPHFLNVANQTLQMNHGVCEPANGVMTCTFDDRVNGQDNLSGGFEFGAQLKFQDNSGKHNETIYINGVAIGQVEVDAGDGSTGNTGGTTGRDFGKWGTRSMEDPSIINWTVELNGDLTYDMIYFTDTPGHGHHILPETVSVGINGQTVDYKNSRHVDSHSVTENSISMQLRTYRLDYSVQKYNATIYYSTKITDENVKGWSNSATMTPHGGQSQSTSTFVEKFGGAWSQGELAKYRGSFTVIKTDEAGTPLQGATFNLKDNEGNVVQTFTTDENGQATIADIAGGHYTLVETAAPVGYVLNEEAMDVMLKFDQEKSVTKEVVNKKAEAPTCTDFTLIVKDGNKEDSKFVEGATVTKDGVVVGTTNENGELVMDPLTPGQDYEFVISKDGETKTVTIKGNSDDCRFEVVLEQPAPKTCEFFTVTVVEEGDVETTIAGAEVVITDGNGETFATGTTEANGQFNTDKPLEVGTNYTVTVKVDGYDVVTKTVTGSTEDCGTKVSVTKTPEKNTCENFTVNTEDGSTVTITDEAGNVVEEGTVEEGTFVTGNPLDPGKDYTVTVEKDGYEKETVEVKGSEENCEITVDLTEVPAKDVCENFTVNTEDGSTVTITDGAGNVVEEGTVEEGTFVTKQPLEPGKDYTVTVEKDGYKTTTQTVTGSEDNCETTIDLVEVPVEKDVCENFTVNVKKDGEIVKDATVQIVDENGNVVVEGTTDENGQFVTEERLTPGNWYEVIVNGNHIQGVKGSEDNCETTIDLVEVPVEKDVCENFTVNVKKDGEIVEDATVQIVDENGNVVAEGTTDENGQFVTEEPLTPGNWYEVIVNGNHIQGVKGSEDNCETTINLVEVPAEKEVCENFTVTVAEKEDAAETKLIEDAQITIKDVATGEVFATGQTNENGQFVTEQPLTVDGTYTVIVEKDGYETIEQTVKGSEDNCGTIVYVTGSQPVTPEPTEPEQPTDPTPVDPVEPEQPETPEPTEPTEPTEPEQPTDPTPVDPVEPEQPEQPGEEKPEPEQPTDPTPVEPEEPTEPEEEDKPGIVENVCTDFTVTVVEKGTDGELTKLITNATVTITDAAGKKVTGTTNKNGQFVSVEPLTPGEMYTVTVKAPSYEKETFEVVGSEDVCGTTVYLTEKPATGGGGGGGGGETPDPTPEHPEKPEPEQPTDPTPVDPIEPVEPEQPEQPGEEKPEPEQPTEPTPVDPVEPVEPEQPENPGQEKPEPTDPTGPKPEKPAPTEPVDPAPEQPTTPEPTEPVEPEETPGGGGTTEPEQPEQPVEEDKPGIVENVCEDFTVETERNAKVVIKDANGQTIAEGRSDENGKFVMNTPLDSDATYTVKVTKSGFYKKEVTVVGSETNCSVEVSLDKRPSGGGGGGGSTEPSNPTDPDNEKDKPAIVEPETPGTETPGTETPETPGTETPETETPETETPETETPEGETSETPEVDEKDKPAVVENDKTPGKPSQPSVNEQDKPSIVDNAGSKAKPSVSKPGQDGSVQGETLPQTGEEQYMVFLGLGLFLVLFGAGMTYRSRKQA